VLLQMLNLLDGVDMRALGHNSPDYIHRIAETVKIAFADRDAYYGDPRFVTIPSARLLSKAHAAERRALVR
jgi:gamma-glutamyltranspeptidase/glutathione hydrolase